MPQDVERRLYHGDGSKMAEPHCVARTLHSQKGSQQQDLIREEKLY
jgi:hypothetical protein